MAKRFYDTGKFKDPWFRRLTPELKCAYDYMLCECNHAGIIDVDLEDLNYKIAPNAQVTFEDLKKNFEDKVVILAEEINKDSKIHRLKLFIHRFIYWQYKNSLTPANQVHRSVISILKDEGICFSQFLRKEDDHKE